MKYAEIAETSRDDRHQHTLPVLTEIQVRGAMWNAFKAAIADDDTAKLISFHSNGQRMVACVACIDDEVADLLTDRWMT
jgi:hypothetical protein